MIHLVSGIFENVLSLKKNLSFYHPSGIRQNLHDGVGGDRLPGARLSYHTKDLPLRKIKRDSVHRLHFSRVGKKGGVKISHGKEGTFLVFFQLDCRLICYCFHLPSLDSHGSRF